MKKKNGSEDPSERDGVNRAGYLLSSLYFPCPNYIPILISALHVKSLSALTQSSTLLTHSK